MPWARLMGRQCDARVPSGSGQLRRADVRLCSARLIGQIGASDAPASSTAIATSPNVGRYTSEAVSTTPSATNVRTVLRWP